MSGSGLDFHKPGRKCENQSWNKNKRACEAAAEAAKGVSLSTVEHKCHNKRLRGEEAITSKAT